MSITWASNIILMASRYVKPQTANHHLMRLSRVYRVVTVLEKCAEQIVDITHFASIDLAKHTTDVYKVRHLSNIQAVAGRCRQQSRLFSLSCKFNHHPMATSHILTCSFHIQHYISNVECKMNTELYKILPAGGLPTRIDPTIALNSSFVTLNARHHSDFRPHSALISPQLQSRTSQERS